MLPDIEKLLQLQVADKEIRKLQEEIAALPKRVAAIEAQLAGTKAQLEKARAAAKADETNRKKFESAIQDLQGKISKYRDQSLEVKTNDQYKALLHEIQFAEQEIRLNEDRILEVMVNVETRDREVKAAEAELKSETAEIEKEKEEARKITAADQASLAEWNAKRDGLRSGISDDLLRHYERVMKFRGSGLAEVATSQFHEVADTTIGTTHGSSSRTLNIPRAGIIERSRRASPRPTSQLPNTPARVKMRVNSAARQNARLVSVSV